MIFDLHCDSILEATENGFTGQVDEKKLAEGGALAQCFAVFINKSKTSDPRGFFDKKSALLERLVNKSDILEFAMTPDEVMSNAENKKISAVLTVEDADLLQNEIDYIDFLFNKGVRMMSVIWNYENCLGFPNSHDNKIHSLPLKPFGRAAIERMNALGMIVDVSHLNRGGFFDVAEISKKPFAASHSCAASLCPHSRNLEDDQLKTLGNAGGVVGVNFYSLFLNPGCEYSRIEDIVRHAEYIANTAGIESVALGSDFDGFDTPLEMIDYSGYPMLIAALEKAFGAQNTEKICCKNFMRVWRDNLA